MNKITDLFFSYFNYLFAMVIAAMYINALIFPNMGVDASFYLRVTECIMDGAVPEHNLRILYPPLIFYMLLPIKLIIGKAIAYELFLGYMFIIQGINALLIYKISGKYSDNRFIKIFAAVLYLFLSIKLEGEYFFLEPFINIWGLMALWIYLQKGKINIVWLILSGFLAILAFLTKQYGLAYAGFIGALIILDDQHSWKTMIKKGFLFLLGLLGGLLAFILLFRIGYGVYYDFFAGGRLGLYGEKDIYGLLHGIFNYLLIAPFILTLFIPSIFNKVLKTKAHFIAYFFLLVLFSIQLYLQQYDHYYILMLPALIMMGIIIFGISKTQNKGIVLLIIILSLCVNELFVGTRTKSLVFSKQSTLSEEINLAKKINEFIPMGSNVYLFANVKLYYLCHFKPAVPEKFGFAWNHTTSLENLNEILKSVKYIVVQQENRIANFPLMDEDISILPLIETYNFHLIARIDNYLIFNKSFQLY